jgi:hypothetical protein
MIQYYYVSVDCGNPAINMTNENNITVVGYRKPAVEGNTIYFICPPELDLAGSRTSTCSADGQWKPDPGEVECKGETLIAFIAICYNNNVYIIILCTHNVHHNNAHKENNEPRPLISEVPVIITASVTITVFVVTAIIFFAIGFLCRHLVRQQENNRDKSATPNPPPENVEDTQQRPSVHELELKTNEAYENVAIN